MRDPLCPPLDLGHPFLDVTLPGDLAPAAVTFESAPCRGFAIGHAPANSPYVPREPVDPHDRLRGLFGVKRPLAATTLRRIAAGVARYVTEAHPHAVAPATHLPHDGLSVMPRRALRVFTWLDPIPAAVLIGAAVFAAGFVFGLGQLAAAVLFAPVSTY